MRIYNHNGEVTLTIGRGIPASFTAGEVIAADLAMDLRGTVYTLDIDAWPVSADVAAMDCGSLGTI